MAQEKLKETAAGHLLKGAGRPLEKTSVKKSTDFVYFTKSTDLDASEPDPSAQGTVAADVDIEALKAGIAGLLDKMTERQLVKTFEDATRLVESDLPLVAPALWADTRRGANSIEFFRTHYSEYVDKGLTRAHIFQLDLPLYRALSKWVSRQDRDKIPDDLKCLLEGRSDRVDAELASAGIVEPTDAYKVFADDPRTANRLYQASRKREM